MHLKKIRIILFVLGVICAVIFINPAFAHKVIIFAWVEDGIIHTQSSFGSNRKAKGCAITVVDEKGRVVHNGLTDPEGNYSFKIPESVDSDLILALEAGVGHKGQWKIPKQELVAESSEQDIPSVMEEKEKLEKGPSLLKIIAGIAIIFFLALGIRFFKRKTP